MQGSEARQKLARIARDHTDPVLTPEKIRRAAGTTSGKYLLGALGTAVLVMVATPSAPTSFAPMEPPE
jgi:hypothetical protein